MGDAKRKHGFNDIRFEAHACAFGRLSNMVNEMIEIERMLLESRDPDIAQRINRARNDIGWAMTQLLPV